MLVAVAHRWVASAFVATIRLFQQPLHRIHDGSHAVDGGWPPYRTRSPVLTVTLMGAVVGAVNGSSEQPLHRTHHRTLHRTHDREGKG